MTNIASTLQSLDEQIVASRDGHQFTRAELSKAFDVVKPADHWKNAIDARVAILTKRERIAIEEAVIFFAGCHADFTPLGGDLFRVTAIGYFAAVGA